MAGLIFWYAWTLPCDGQGVTAYPSTTFQNCEAWSNLSTPTILSIPAKLAWLPLGAAAGGITFLIEKLVRK